MADIVFIIGVIVFFALAAALVVGCDRIVRSGDDGSQPVSDTETPADVAS
jgi:hypothetical protein